MDDLLARLTSVCTRLETLEQRVAALEAVAAAGTPVPAPTQARSTQVTADGDFELPQPAGVFPVVGRAMLGMAGAYVLRAVSESNAVPKLVIVALALCYAGAWLFWATRRQVASRFASIVYTITAAMILAPMLAELTLRFKILSSPATAALLCAFVMAASALAWKRQMLAVTWVAAVTGVGTSLVLLVLTRDIVPYVCVLLAIVAISEFAAASDRWRSLRALAAPAIDVVLWTMLYVFSLPAESRVEYVPTTHAVLIAVPLLVFLLYTSSIAYRTMRLRRPVTVFEILQATMTLTFAGLSLFWFVPGTGLLLAGVGCWALAAGCYAATFVCFRRGELRNYRVYAVWSSVLVLAGSFLVLPAFLAALLLGAAALVSILAGVQLKRLMPCYQGLAYVIAAALFSGLLPYDVDTMGGTISAQHSWILWGAALCVAACYTFATRFAGELWNQRLLRFSLALLASCTLIALLISAGISLVGGTAAEWHVALVRTLVACLVALALAYVGGRRQRVELIWTAYCVLAYVTLKLLFQDLRYGHSGLIAVSLCAYAVALIMVPRMARSVRQQKERQVEVVGATAVEDSEGELAASAAAPARR